MKKVILITCLLIITLSGSILLYLSQMHEQKTNGEGLEDLDPTYDVKITDFKWTSHWESPGGVQAAISFNITLHNSKNKDIDGLSVDVKMLNANGDELQTETMFYGQGIIGNGATIQPFDGILHGGENLTLRGGIVSDWGTMTNAWDLGSITTLVDVKLGSVVLDECNITQP